MRSEEMDGRHHDGPNGRGNNIQELQQNASPTTSRTMERPNEQRSRMSRATIRTVTPDPGDHVHAGSRPRTPIQSSEHDATALQPSPRSIPGGEKSKDRRQGLVFRDNFDASDSSPSGTSHRILANSSQVDGSSPTTSPVTRQRSRTLDEPKKRRQASTTVSKSRHRIGSVHSTNSLGMPLETERLSSDQSSGHTSRASLGQPQIQKSNSVKERPVKSRRLLKKSSYTLRSSSPPLSPPSVGSLPTPVATTNANKILKLMGSLNGRMRGDVEYQTSAHGPWASGICYIDEKGCLIYEGEDNGPFYQTLVPDLRGSRVRPTLSLDKQERCLEIETLSGAKLRILPLIANEFDHWLASLLSWQQTRPGTSQINLSIPEVATPKSEQLNRSSSSTMLKAAAVIKVGKILLWEKVFPLPTSSVKRRMSRRNSRPPARSWRRVSCILQDNGEFKLMTENDVILLSIIQLSQLSRCAVQQLDRSVLDEDYCIAIFPQYTPSSTALSIIRPVYIALESRVLFEVWFVLLRAFAVPEIYGPQHSSTGGKEKSDTGTNNTATATSEMFRIEKSLSVRIIEAKLRAGISKPDGSTYVRSQTRSEHESGRGDYFAEVILDGEVRSRTTTKMDTSKPFWREDCEFLDLPAALPDLSIVLKKAGSPSEGLHSANHSGAGGNNSEQRLESLCGTVQIHLDQLEHSKYSESWWPILDDKQGTIGEMFLRVRHDELVVLLSRDYQPLSELLHRFGSGLTVQISQVVSSNLRDLSETLVNIFQVSGQSASWLMALVEEEIDGIGKETPVTRLRFSSRVGSNDSGESVGEREQSVRDTGKTLTGEANLLFRGNSLLTQALDFHMRRVGKDYLDEVLSHKIRQIVALDPDCEVDPSRLSHGDELGDRWTLLIALTTSVWDAIAASANKCPSELRQILKYIRAVAEDRYGVFLRTVPYTSVSGFLFLRFFCPAILNPKLFGLLRDHPQPKAQRTLTLIAKSLQNLANLSTFGQKELWMEPMNRFLGSHRQSLKDFIDDFCSIPAERLLHPIPASYSTPITILGRLPPTSREGFPSLPYLIDHARNFAALIKLWLDGTPEYLHSTLNGDLLEFHKQCISLQRRASDCLQRAENDSSALKLSDPTSPSGEKHTETPESASLFPPLVSQASSSSSPLAPRHQHSSHSLGRSSNGSSHAAPGSAGSETGSRERRERLSFWETAFGKDPKYQKLYGPGPSAGTAGAGRGRSESPPERLPSRSERKSFAPVDSTATATATTTRTPSRSDKKGILSRFGRRRESEGPERDRSGSRDEQQERGVSRDGTSDKEKEKERGRHEPPRSNNEYWGRLATGST